MRVLGGNLYILFYICFTGNWCKYYSSFVQGRSMRKALEWAVSSCVSMAVFSKIKALFPCGLHVFPLNGVKIMSRDSGQIWSCKIGPDLRGFSKLSCFHHHFFYYYISVLCDSRAQLYIQNNFRPQKKNLKKKKHYISALLSQLHSLSHRGAGRSQIAGSLPAVRRR